MSISDTRSAEIAANFKHAVEPFRSSAEDEARMKLACQISVAWASVVNRPREELSDQLIVDAIAMAVSDILCNAVKRDDFEVLAWRILDQIEGHNSAMMEFGFPIDWYLPDLSRADHEALVTCVAEQLARRVRHADWVTSILGGEDSLHFEEFGRRAERNPAPTGPLDPFWQAKSNCKEIIGRLEANHPIVVAAELLLKEIETEQRDGIARAGSGELHHG